MSSKKSGGGGSTRDDNVEPHQPQKRQKFIVNRLMIDTYTCLIPEKFEGYKELFSFMLPASVYKDNATNFDQFNDDEISAAFRHMFHLWVRFCQDLKNTVQHKTTMALKQKTKNPNEKEKKTKKKKPKKNGGGTFGEFDINTDNERDSSDSDSDSEAEEDTRDDAVIDLDSQEKEDDRAILNDREAQLRSGSLVEFMMEAILHKSQSTTPSSSSLADRKVLGYRFWLFNFSTFRGRDVFEHLMLEIKRINASIDSGKIRDFKPKDYQTYFSCADPSILAKYYGVYSGHPLREEDIKKFSSLPYNHNDNYLKPDSIFSPLRTIVHPGIVMKALAKQCTDYSNEACTSFSFPPDVAKFVYRFQHHDINEKKINRAPFPTFQKKSVSHIAKLLPLFIEQLKDNNNNGGGGGLNGSILNTILNPQSDVLPLSQPQSLNGDGDDDDDDNEEKIDRKPDIYDLTDNTARQLSAQMSIDLKKYIKDTVIDPEITKHSYSVTQKRVDAKELQIYESAIAANMIQFESSSSTMTSILTSPYVPLHTDSVRSMAMIQTDLITNKARYEEKITDVESLSRKLFLLYQRKTIEDYEATCLTDLSQYAMAIIEYSAKEKLFEKPNARLLKSATWATPYKCYEQTMALEAEHVYNVNDKHALLVKLHKNSFDAYRVDFNSVHQHVLMQSTRGNDSKSYLEHLLHHEMLIPHTSTIITYQSLKAKAVDANLNDAITFFDEMPASLLDAKKGDEQERMMKQLLSSNKVEADILTIDKGKRYMKHVTCEAITVFIGAMNLSDDILSSAMKRRWDIIHCDEKKDPARTTVEMAAFEKLNKKTSSDPYMQYVNRRNRLVQTLVFHTEKFIYTGALHKVSQDVAEIMIVYVSNELSARGYPEPNPSAYERIRVASRVNCIIDAVVTNWIIESGEFAGQPITFDQFTRLDMKLWVNAQHVVKALGDHAYLLIDPAESIVRQALVSYNETCDKLHQRYRSYKVGKYMVPDPGYLRFPAEKDSLKGLARIIITEIRNMPETLTIPSESYIISILMRWLERRVYAHKYECKRSGADEFVIDNKYQGAPTFTYEVERDINNKPIVVLNETIEPRYEQAVIMTEHWYQVHRDFLIDATDKPQSHNAPLSSPQQPQSTIVSDSKHKLQQPRDVIASIIKKIFSYKGQIAHRFIFDNHPDCPKYLSYVECAGPAQNETSMLHLRSVTSIGEFDKFALTDYNQFNMTRHTQDIIYINEDIDSWALRRHNERIGLTKKPILKGIYDITKFMIKPMLDGGGDGKKGKKKLKVATKKVHDSGNDSSSDESSEEEDAYDSDSDDDFDDPSLKYDYKGEGYFMGTPVSQLFIDHTRTVGNMTSESIREIYQKLDQIEANVFSDPLAADLDFNPAYYVIEKHESGEPLFHTYFCDIRAKAQYETDMNRGAPIATAENVRDGDGRWLYVPVPKKLEEMERMDIDILRENRRECLRHNIPQLKVLHTHPNIVNTFLNTKISTYRTISTNCLTPDKEKIMSRSDRWRMDRDLDMDEQFIANILAGIPGFRGEFAGYKWDEKTSKVVRDPGSTYGFMIEDWNNEMDIRNLEQLPPAPPNVPSKKSAPRSHPINVDSMENYDDDDYMDLEYDDRDQQRHNDAATYVDDDHSNLPTSLSRKMTSADESEKSNHSSSKKHHKRKHSHHHRHRNNGGSSDNNSVYDSNESVTPAQTPQISKKHKSHHHHHSSGSGSVANNIAATIFTPGAIYGSSSKSKPHAIQFLHHPPPTTTTTTTIQHQHSKTSSTKKTSIPNSAIEVRRAMDAISSSTLNSLRVRK